MFFRAFARKRACTHALRSVRTLSRAPRIQYLCDFRNGLYVRTVAQADEQRATEVRFAIEKSIIA